MLGLSNLVIAASLGLSLLIALLHTFWVAFRTPATVSPSKWVWVPGVQLVSNLPPPDYCLRLKRARLLSEKTYAVTGKLVAIDATGLVGPFFTVRMPAKGFDLHRPGTYIDLTLLDPGQVVFKKKIHINDELRVIINPSTAFLERGTRNEMTFQIDPRGKCRRISHCRRVFETHDPVNGKVTESDGKHVIAMDVGLPVVVSLLQHTPSQTKQIKLNSWLTFWPAPPVHGLILGKA